MNEVKSEMLRQADGTVFDWNFGMSYQIVRIGDKRVKIYLTPDLFNAYIKADYDASVFTDEAIRLINSNEAIFI